MKIVFICQFLIGFFTWWKNFGTASNIFRDKMKHHLRNWMSFSPTVNDCKDLYIIEGRNICLFFVQFGFPWIWKWKPIFGYNDMMIPCIMKYWDKLDRVSPGSDSIEGFELYKTIDNQIHLYKQMFEQDQIKKDLEIPVLSSKFLRNMQELSLKKR